VKLVHFGCSFAVGNAVPRHIPGLESGAYIHKVSTRRKFEKKYKMIIKEPTNCGKALANKLKFDYEMVAENGASNERIVRRVLHKKLKDSFVLIGFTSYNRREGLTTNKENSLAKRASHWHTWKMVGPEDNAGYKDLKFDPWVNKDKREYYPAIEEEGQIRTVIQILYMQNYFKANNVPYLMYNALYNGFDDPLTDECKKLLGMVDQKKYYKLQGSFDETQHGWCLKNKLTVSEIDEHPNTQGQTAWAEELMPLVLKGL
tara:strand:- start:1079 stop:1855 length:777 start_codon:yes stop_codon:yes gene_type:complete